jgi:endoglucanase
MKDSNFIQLNQLGFYPYAPKIAIVTKSGGHKFVIMDIKTRAKVFSGTLGESVQSKNSSLICRKADFSAFTRPGLYVLVVDGVGESWPFKIGAQIHESVAISSLKGFYYQRVSTPLDKNYAGKWARPAGHLDTAVLVHPSAASANRPAGTIISSPGGWYDAGDYNKYIVNSGITMGTLLSAYEDWPEHFKQLQTNIPESGNDVPDLLDEVLVNLRWMNTMQDPNDGGVYNKCTNANFDGMVMPGVTRLPRYVVQKGTAATLDFVAVMAQASRVFSKYSKQLPGLSDSCLQAAIKGWDWAKKNPAMAYDQQSINKEYDPDINTGGYGDRNFEDEWYWAATEMFVATLDESYYQVIRSSSNRTFSLQGWPNVGMMGYLSLLRNSPSLDREMPRYISDYIIGFADSLVANMKTNAFHTVMGGRVQDFSWGSNAVAANQAIVLLSAWKIKNDNKYVAAALSNLDYILGRNATGYCFVTGSGSKSTINPHHRPSAADGIPEPVPGLLAGGPNPARQDKCFYPFTEPETAYTDRECSYASNEIAINWNAPLVYLVNAIEAIQYRVGYSRGKVDK